MKKGLIGIMVLVLSVFVSVSTAADGGILDFFKFAETQDDTFGYSYDDKLEIKYVSSSYIDIESPIIKSQSHDVTTYMFNVSTSTENASPVYYWCVYDISKDGVTLNKSKDSFTVSLDTASLNRDKVYYIYAYPVDYSVAVGENGVCSASDAEELLKSGLWGRESMNNGEDPCFKINGSVYGEGNACEDRSSEDEGNSSSNSNIYTITSNGTHLCDSKKVKVGWNSFDDVDIEVFLWYDDEDTFKKIGKVKSDEEVFIFNQVFDGDHIVRLKPSDGTTPVDYTIHCLQSVSTQVEPVTPSNPVKPPVVGPKENILLIIFGTLILYIVYRVSTRKRS